MIQIELAPEEAAMLQTILDDYLSDLRMEIAGTDRKDFREELKQRRDVIVKVMTLLQPERISS
ncbi:MAG: hypothetical protein ACLFVO_14350 [Chloroflexaceae bacterium]